MSADTSWDAVLSSLDHLLAPEVDRIRDELITHPHHRQVKSISRNKNEVQMLLMPTKLLTLRFSSAHTAARFVENVDGYFKRHRVPVQIRQAA
jgi:hypothetical protein